jgi:hypothetical protein
MVLLAGQYPSRTFDGDLESHNKGGEHDYENMLHASRCANKLVRPRFWKSTMSLTLIAGVLLAAVSLACQTPSLPAIPSTSMPGVPTPVTVQLMVVADPSGSAWFLLNSVPLDRAQYAPGEQITIDVYSRTNRYTAA